MARPKDPHARASLVAAARAEFVAHGILKARIEDITAACGLSKGAFYLHFASKEALFRELTQAMEAEFDRLQASRQRAYRTLVADRAVPTRGTQLARRVRAVDLAEDHRLLELLWKWRDVIDVLLRGCQGTEFDGVMWEILDQQAEQGRDQFRWAQSVRLVRGDVSADALSVMVVGSYLMLARRWVQAKERPDFDELLDGLQRVVARGISPPGGDRFAAPASPRPHGVRERARRPSTRVSTNQQRRKNRSPR